ncbi:MAG: hypothetical protein MJE68_14250 [Proteobacteria bacterium]|nr:hypothetical protein [Pseudomonadota bacterium]
MSDKGSENPDSDKAVLWVVSRHLRLGLGCKVQRDGKRRAEVASQRLAASSAESEKREGLEKRL